MFTPSTPPKYVIAPSALKIGLPCIELVLDSEKTLQARYLGFFDLDSIKMSDAKVHSEHISQRYCCLPKKANSHRAEILALPRIQLVLDLEKTLQARYLGCFDLDSIKMSDAKSIQRAHFSKILLPSTKGNFTLC